MLDWRIYYSDASTADSEQFGPDEVPKEGVQVILVRDGRKGRRVLRLCDYYLWRPRLNRWTDHIDSSSALIAAISEPWTVILRGEYLEEGDFEKILIAAHNDLDFPGASVAPHPAWKA